MLVHPGRCHPEPKRKGNLSKQSPRTRVEEIAVEYVFILATAKREKKNRIDICDVSTLCNGENGFATHEERERASVICEM